MNTVKDILWKASTILPAIIFTLAGVSKLADPHTNYIRFEDWGYPAWFAIVVGVVEVLGGIALAIPAFCGLAAMVLGIDMLGAMFTHLRAEEYSMLPVPTMLFLIMAYVDMVKRDELVDMMDKVMDFMHIPHRPHHI